MNIFKTILDEIKLRGHKYVTNPIGFGMAVAEFKSVYAHYDEEEYDIFNIDRQENLSIISTQIGEFKTF
jgi:hypothetical protein